MTEPEEAFMSMAVNSVIEDLDGLVDGIFRYEAMSRHAVAVNDDYEAAEEFANEAGKLIMDVPYRTIPTVIMAMADRFNREREAYLATLDELFEAQRLLTEILTKDEVLLIPISQAASLGHVRRRLVEALEAAPYSRREERE